MILNNKEVWVVFVQNEVLYTKSNYWDALPFYLNAIVRRFQFLPPKIFVNKADRKGKIQKNKKRNLDQMVLWLVWKPIHWKYDKPFRTLVK